MMDIIMSPPDIKFNHIRSFCMECVGGLKKRLQAQRKPVTASSVLLEMLAFFPIHVSLGCGLSMSLDCV